MTKYWVVECQDDAWEPNYPQFRTSSKQYAEWYCNEVNKCTDNWETYYVCEHHPIPIVVSDYTLTLGFAFTPHPNFKLEASENRPYELDAIGYNRELGLILVNGTGGTYESCLIAADTEASIIDLYRLTGVTL